MYKLEKILIILYFLCKRCGLVYGVCTTSDTILVENHIANYTEEELSFSWKPGDKTCQWKIKGAGVCPIGIKCYIKVPRGTATLIVEDGKGTIYFRGEGDITARPSDPNLKDLYVRVRDADLVPENTPVYIHCIVQCDLENEYTPLIPTKRKNNPLIYHLTQEVTFTSGASTFVWPPRNDSKEELIFWSVFGEHECTVEMNCTISHNGDCTETGAYVEVSDGISGEQKYCGDVSFEHTPSDPLLRDMFLKIHSPGNSKLFNVSCSAYCDSKAVNKSLPLMIEKKTDLRCVCGLHNTDDRIIGGESASANEFPWQVAVVIANSRVSFCGGTVINDRFVLTAKHCFHNNENIGLDDLHKFEVLVHVHALTQNFPDNVTSFDQLIQGPIEPSVLALDEQEKTQRLKVLELITTDLFIRFNDDYDIVLLRLDGKIDLTSADGITPICLPSAGDHDTFYQQLVGKTLTALGWGFTEKYAQSPVLKKVDVPYVPDEECVEPVKLLAKTFTPRMMCAFYRDGTINDTCSGDSGGPLMFKQNNNQFIQVGITSFGGNCYYSKIASVYTKVSELAQWIGYFSNIWGAKWCQESPSA